MNEQISIDVYLQGNGVKQVTIKGSGWRKRFSVPAEHQLKWAKMFEAAADNLMAWEGAE